jgi:hypothetical protein
MGNASQKFIAVALFLQGIGFRRQADDVNRVGRYLPFLAAALGFSNTNRR